MELHYLETGKNDPYYNLAFEQYVLEHKSEGDWLLLWQNDNTVVVGINQNTEEEVEKEFVAKHKISVVRRMTGGGAVYHDLGNLNYSFITDVGAPEELTISRFCEPVCDALKKLGLNAELSGRNDILIDGKKISGSAQRVYKNRVLHHGTLLFDTDVDMVTGALKPDLQKFVSKSAKSVRSRIGMIKDFLPKEITLGDFWRIILEELSCHHYVKDKLSADEIAAIEKLAEEKYRTWEWNFGRNPDYQFRNRLRFDGGSLEVCYNIHQNLFSDIQFFGDYLALQENADLVRAFIGLPAEKSAVSDLLDRFDLSLMFGSITKENILQTMFD